jgi:chorismate mutase
MLLPLVIRANASNFDMQFFKKSALPILVAGPCSAETREQVLATARDLQPAGITLFRAGLWKPRTRPGAFEGVGAEGLAWLQEAQQQYKLKVTTEVATPEHVELCLRAGIDALWVGARTTVNPFMVQEIAEALRGVQIPVMVKNPVNPDLKLWIGAIERLQNCGITDLAAIHRGFSAYGDQAYRNPPLWQIPIDFALHFPDMPIICDASHICGRRDTLLPTAQTALDLHFDGIHLEVHPTPDAAWSDAKQQITPEQYRQLLEQLVRRNAHTTDPDYLHEIGQIREQIDRLDQDMLEIVAKRMELARAIGTIKRNNQVAILQPERWARVLQIHLERGAETELGAEFVSQLVKAIHQESIRQQVQVMGKTQ